MRIYESVSDVVYPKYSVIDPKPEILSGFSVQSAHLYIGFGIFAATLHGIIGMRIDIISVAVATIPEYINLFLNCIVLYIF